MSTRRRTTLTRERVFVDSAGDLLSTRFDSEHELRTGIARVADAYGWIVQEEVEVRGWGRIDIVLRSAPRANPMLVELKVELVKPSEVRKAFQQVDGYSRWWAKEKGEPNRAVLVANKADMALISSIGDAYPTVKYRSAYNVLVGMRTWEVTDTRRATAQRRMEERRRQYEINEFAVEALDEDHQDKEWRAALAAEIAAEEAAAKAAGEADA